MRWRAARSFIAFLTVIGCTVPPVDPTFISSVPADPQSFAVAQKAVRACSDPLNKERVLKNFQRAGFTVSQYPVASRFGGTATRIDVSAPDPAVSVLYQSGRCYVGLEGMTPSQSAQLAEIWVNAHNARPNSEFGDGLSDHVSGAWRHFFTEPARVPSKAAYYHRIYIAAYKTWPHGAYDPQSSFAYDISGVFPDKPGAAVELNHAFECKPYHVTGPNSGAYLPCSEPDYRPN
ncbi:hypothetical protein [Dinoroseobacter sp. S375]|uniref:hypothetical protein n=1 Tax=Dinoroseobacter sp. S375 TaxID=3415136 RepID=UPI003C7E556E